MATFQNQATLSYGGITLSSNIVTGEFNVDLAITKTPVVSTYAAGETVTYVISIVNSGSLSYSDLTLTDDLGGYTVTGGTAYPLTYTENSVNYYINGVLQAAPTVNAGPPLTIAPISVPAGGNATIVYQASVNAFAPLAEGSVIQNTATLSGAALTDPLSASATVTVLAAPILSLTKGLEPTVVSDGGTITYTLRIENAGNLPITAEDDLTVNDTFDPVLENITVMLNGAAMPATDYTYSAEGLFATVAGAVTVPAASFVTDPETGAVIVTPGVTVLTISGTFA